MGRIGAVRRVVSVRSIYLKQVLGPKGETVYWTALVFDKRDAWTWNHTVVLYRIVYTTCILCSVYYTSSDSATRVH